MRGKVDFRGVVWVKVGLCGYRRLYAELCRERQISAGLCV